MYDLNKILDEAESLVTTFPQREALLRKAVAYFEQGSAVLRQAGYDPLQFTVEGVVAAAAQPQLPDTPAKLVLEDEPNLGALVRQNGEPPLVDINQPRAEATI